ncbi:hypothetical protein AURDEDRAFT_110315 [Auricularia subglabra TFB-10046 SS5]|nr:hypothetical protein AURDEDRAFT_110315 [Auricularia subglabra TFB-10046 SS5]
MAAATRPKIDPQFLQQCVAISEIAARPQGSPPISPRPTIVSASPTIASALNNADDQLARHARIVANYVDAFTDTHGTVSGAPFLYKTGKRWPRREGPEAQPFARRLFPVYDHPIMAAWTGILDSVIAYLVGRNLPFSAVMGLGWGNQGDATAFCPLVVTIGVEPGAVTFSDAQTAANHVKDSIIGAAGFSGIDVAIWEWQTSFSALGPKLPSLDPLVNDDVVNFTHRFSSVLGLAIAPYKHPSLEGTVALYLRRGNDSDRVLALTVAHVARPAIGNPSNHGLTDGGHRDGIIALGEKGYHDAVRRIEARIGTLYGIAAESQEKIDRLLQRQAEASEPSADIDAALRRMQEKIVDATSNIEQLDKLHTRVSKTMGSPEKRVIGHVLHSEPIRVSSAPERFTIDWAVIELTDDAFNWPEFKGNKVYIGDDFNKETFRELMFPWAADSGDFKYPQDGLLQVFGVVPEREICRPLQRSGTGDLALPVIKNGLTTGSTVGWVNGLKSVVRHYTSCGLTFDSLETTFLPYGNRGAFSAPGDSGSIILDRTGRIVALLTGGGGLTEEHDLTFGTAWYALEPHIKEVFKGALLY